MIAVGWLDVPYPYPQGGVPSEFSNRLFSLFENAWDPIRFRGKHDCTLCNLAPREVRNSAGLSVDVGAINLFVPNEASTGFFAAPSLILHYIVDHGYRPPLQFQTAVMTCPATNSSRYFRQVERIIPTSKRWRDGVFGYWASMGAAIADEAGLMSSREYDASFAEFSKDRFTYPPKDLPAEAPRWFANQHIEPLLALAKRLETEGQNNDMRAVLAWINSVNVLGRLAPAAR